MSPEIEVWIDRGNFVSIGFIIKNQSFQNIYLHQNIEPF